MASPPTSGSRSHFTIPARTGLALPLQPNQTIKIINTHGQQVVDFWALVLPTTSSPRLEYMSMCHTRAATDSLCPQVGDKLVTQARKTILDIIEDTSPGAHDTLIAPCDPERYTGLGVEGWHASCKENFHLALKKAGVGSLILNLMGGRRAQETSEETEYWCPDSLNLFMNIPFQQPRQHKSRQPNGTSSNGVNANHEPSASDGAIDPSTLKLLWRPPPGKKGDFVTFRNVRDTLVWCILSACPQDIIPINDQSGRGPADVEVVVGDRPTDG